MKKFLVLTGILGALSLGFVQQYGSYVETVNSTVTAAGTTTLTVTSARQQVFTGSTTQTVVLPDATTMPNGMSFQISNQSSGNVTVEYDDNTTAATLAQDSEAIFLLTDNGSSNGTWAISEPLESGNITNSDIDASAGIEFSKMEALGTDAVAVTDGSGEVGASATITTTELGYLNGLTSSVISEDDYAQVSNKDFFDNSTNFLDSSLGGSSGFRFDVQGASGNTIMEVPNGSSDITLTLPDATGTLLNDPLTTKGDIIVNDGSDTTRLGVGSNGQVLVADSTQTEGVKWAAPASGGINWLSGDDKTIDASAGSWAAYADAAGTDPADGTGGSPTVTCARTTTASELLRGAGTLELAKDASDRQGEGCSVDFTIDPGYYEKPKAHTTCFVYDASANFDYGDGTYSDPSDVTVWIYDKDNSQLIQPVPYVLDGSGKYCGEWAPANDADDYRLILHVGTTNASAYDFFMDDFEVGPSVVAYGAIVTDSVAFTPSSAPTDYTFGTSYFARTGDRLSARIALNVTGASATDSFSVANLLPSGMTVNEDKLAENSGAIDQSPAGLVHYTDTGTGAYVFGLEYRKDSNTFNVREEPGVTYPTEANGDFVTVFLQDIPIQGWGSTTKVSSGDSLRPEFAEMYRSSSSNHTSSGNWLQVALDAVQDESHGGGDTANNQYIIQSPGVKALSGQVTFADITSGNVGARIKVDGTVVTQVTKQGGTTSVTIPVAAKPLNLNVGAVITLEAFQQDSATEAYVVGRDRTWLAVHDASGRQQFAASESIHALYFISGSTANASFADAAEEIVDYDTQQVDNAGLCTTGASWGCTFQKAARCTIGGTLHWANTTNMDDSYVELDLAGTDVQVGRVVGGGGTLQHNFGPITWQFNAGDTFEVRAYQDDSASSARSLSTSNNRGYISIYCPGGV